MAESTLQRVLDFNKQLNKLSRAGVPIDLDQQKVEPGSVVPRSPNSWMQQSLQRIDNALKLRVELGQPIDDAIDSAPELSPRYRASLKTWLQLADPSASLGPLIVTTRDRQDVTRGVNIALIQPLVIFTLAFIAFLLLCWFTVPRLEAFYAQNWIVPKGMLAVLLRMRDTLPIWGIAIPVALLAVCVAWKHQSSRFSVHRLLPGGRRYLQSLCHANFADQVSKLIKNDVPLEQAMLLADPELGGKYIANRVDAPPLLRWALTGDLGGEPLWSVLRFVSLTYRQVAEQHASVWRAVLPTVLGAIVGGVIVFAYGLSLFLPMIDALNMISLPQPS